MKLGKNSIRVGGTALLTGALIVGGFLGGTWLLQTVQFAHAQQQVETTREQLAQVEDLASVFRQVNQSIEASVVNIRVEKQVPGPQMMPFDDDMMRRFFPDEDGDGKPDLPERFGNRRGDAYRQEGTGSGVIMDVENGSAYILTNNHVAGDASKLVVTLNDGRKIDNGTVVAPTPRVIWPSSRSTWIALSLRPGAIATSCRKVIGFLPSVPLSDLSVP